MREPRNTSVSRLDPRFDRTLKLKLKSFLRPHSWCHAALIYSFFSKVKCITLWTDLLATNLWPSHLLNTVNFGPFRPNRNDQLNLSSFEQENLSFKILSLYVGKCPYWMIKTHFQKNSSNSKQFQNFKLVNKPPENWLVNWRVNSVYRLGGINLPKQNLSNESSLNLFNQFLNRLRFLWSISNSNNLHKGNANLKSRFVIHCWIWLDDWVFKLEVKFSFWIDSSRLQYNLQPCNESSESKLWQVFRRSDPLIWSGCFVKLSFVWWIHKNKYSHQKEEMIRKSWQPNDQKTRRLKERKTLLFHIRFLISDKNGKFVIRLQ